MSLLSAVGSAGSSLFGFLQKLTGQQQTNSTSGTSSSNSLSSLLNGANNSDSNTASLLSPHHGMKKALMKKIESAVTTALQQVTSGATAGTGSASTPADVNSVIQKAIEGVLNSSADGAPLEAEPENASTSSSSLTSAASAQGEGTQAAFMQLLKANGVDGKQFGKDFQAALEQVQGGGINLNSILSGMAPGSLLDEIA